MWSHSHRPVGRNTVLKSWGQFMITAICWAFKETTTPLFARCKSSGGNTAPLISWYLEDYLQSQPSVGQFLNYTLLCQDQVTWRKPCSSDLLVPGRLSAVTAIYWAIFELHSSLPGASHVVETLLLWSSGTWRTICSHSHLLGNF